MRLTLFLALLLWLPSLTAPALAQNLTFSSQANPPLSVEEAFRMEVLGSEGNETVIGWTIAPDYYLYRDAFAASNAAGQNFTVTTQPGVPKDDPTFGQVEVHYDNAEIVLSGAGGEIVVTWQGCQEDGICYMPMESILTLPEITPLAATADAAPGLQLVEGGGMLDGLAARGGVLLVLAGFLGFGLLLAFTPCVFPMVPIMAAMLAREGETLTAMRGAALSGTYILSMATAFGVLGAVAGWSGQNLQLVLQSPWAVGFVAGLFVLLAGASFGLLDVKLPQAMVARVSRPLGRRGSVAGAAGLGFTSALIVGPCVTAPLAGALLYIVRTGDIALGAGALFALGLGQGIPLFLAGTVGAGVLPRAGAWMEEIRKIFGVVFLALAIWLAGRLLPGPLTLALWAGLLVGCGMFLGALDRLPPKARPGVRLTRVAGRLSLAVAAVLGIGAGLGAQDPLRPLAPLAMRGTDGDRVPAGVFQTVATPAALQTALDAAPERPAVVYVTADWCVICRVIERDALPDPAVTAALDGLLLIKADVTDIAAGGQGLMDMLGAFGPPTMVFLDPTRAEAPQTRLIGTTRPADIIRSAARLLEGNV